MSEAQSFGQWLKAQRQALDLTREDLAERVGCASVTITKIERGQRRPSRQVAERIAEALRLPDDQQAQFVDWARGASTSVALEPPGPPSLAEPSPSHQQEQVDNLPASLTSFVGRDSEVAKARSILWRADTRLLTMTGPPGIGKTRLALTVAASLREDFRDGVWFVPLAPLSDAALVASTIGKSLGITETVGEPVETGLQNYVKDKVMLLLLDNFEHVMPAAPLVSRLLASAPRLKVLVTSREALHLYGEHEFIVPALDLPDLQHIPDVEALPQCASVALFVARAQAVKSDFTLTEDNAFAVAQICVQLDGQPLAIELAAARAKLFDPRAMLPRLENRLALLAGGARDLPVRQQTLRGAIEWSYSLLSEGEKVLFRRLSVFRGGRSVEAVEAVCGGADMPGYKALLSAESSRADADAPDPTSITPLQIDVLEGLESLTSKSLIGARAGAEGLPRFWMLETIFEFASEKLEESGEAYAVRLRHALYYMELAVESREALRGPEQAAWIPKLEEEHDNVRAALAWVLRAGEYEIGMYLAGALQRFWLMRSYLLEGQRWLESLLKAAPDSRSEARAIATQQAGSLAAVLDEPARAIEWFEESLRLWSIVGDRARMASTLAGLASAHVVAGDYSDGFEVFAKSLEIFEELNDEWYVSLIVGNMGFAAVLQGLPEKAEQLCKRGLEIQLRLKDEASSAITWLNLGLSYTHQHSYDQGIDAYNSALTAARRSGDSRTLALALTYLGLSYALQHKDAEAETYYRESLHVFKSIGHRFGMARNLVGIARIAAGMQRYEDAVRLAAAAEAHCPSLHTSMTPAERSLLAETLEQAAAKLGEDRFRAAQEEGRAMSLDAAISLSMRATSSGRERLQSALQ